MPGCPLTGARVLGRHVAVGGDHGGAVGRRQAGQRGAPVRQRARQPEVLAACAGRTSNALAGSASLSMTGRQNKAQGVGAALRSWAKCRSATRVLAGFHSQAALLKGGHGLLRLPRTASWLRRGMHSKQPATDKPLPLQHLYGMADAREPARTAIMARPSAPSRMLEDVRSRCTRGGCTPWAPIPVLVRLMRRHALAEDPSIGQPLGTTAQAGIEKRLHEGLMPHLVQVCGAPRDPERHREPRAPAQLFTVQRGAQAAARRERGDRDAVIAGRAHAQQGDHVRVAQARQQRRLGVELLVALRSAARSAHAGEAQKAVPLPLVTRVSGWALLALSQAGELACLGERLHFAGAPQLFRPCMNNLHPAQVRYARYFLATSTSELQYVCDRAKQPLH